MVTKHLAVVNTELNIFRPLAHLIPGTVWRDEGYDLRSTEEENCLRVWMTGSGASTSSPQGLGMGGCYYRFQEAGHPPQLSPGHVCFPLNSTTARVM